MAASTADDDELDNSTEFYAEIILTCRGQYDDPCLDSRLDDITNQLHTLSKDNDRPLVVDVRPWNSVRVTLKVSRETASALQRLAQRRDPKLTDIGILSVQVDGGSVLHLNHDQDILPDASQNASNSGVVSLLGVPDCQRESVVNVKSNDISLRLGNSVSSTRPTTVTGPSQYDISSHSVVTNKTQSSSSSSKSNIAIGCKDNAWHPLEGRQASVVTTAVPTSDSSSCFWNQMSSDWRQNGLNTDPFQFSADDLLTRMLADVPTPKQRRQRLRNGSAATDLLRFDVNVPVQNSALKQNDSLCVPPSEVDIQNKQCSIVDNQFNALELGWPQGNTKSENSGELKDRRHHPAHDYRLAVGRSYVDKNSIDSNSAIFPGDHSNMHKEEELSFSSGRVSSSNQPTKRRRMNARTNCMDLVRDESQEMSSVPDRNTTYAQPGLMQRDELGIDSCRINSSSGLGVGFAPSERLSVKPSSRITSSDQSELQHVNYHPLHAMTSYPVSHLRHGSSQDRSMCSSSYASHSHGSSIGGSTSANTHYQTIAPISDISCYSGSGAMHSTRSRFEMEKTGLSVPMSSRSMHTVGSNVSCMADVRNRVSPYLPSYVSPMMSSSSASYSGSSPVDTSCMIHLTGPDSGNHLHQGFGEMDSLVDRNPSSMSTTTCTASPHETWTSGELDYFGACGADSGIASNTSLSVGSDHSENDRASTETAIAESTCSVKRSPITHADNSIMSPLLTGMECSSRSLPVGGKDMKSISTSVGMSDEATSPSAGRSSWTEMSPFSANQQLSDCAFTSTVPDTSRTTESVRVDARQRFIRKSRQTPTVVAECPPAITCPSLPRRLSESVKRAMRGVGELPNPPLAAAPCDSGPTKVVIRITKTRCNGGNEAKRSKHKEQWCVQPILKPLVQSAECSSEMAPGTAAVAVDAGYHSPQFSNKLSCKSSPVNDLSNLSTLEKTMNCSNQTECSDDLITPSFDPANHAPANTFQSGDNTSLGGGTYALTSHGVQQVVLPVDSKTRLDCSASE